MEDVMTDEHKNAEENQGVAAAPSNQVPEEAQQTPSAPTPDASEQEKSRYQQRIDQLTAARRAAEERSQIAEERVARMEQDRQTRTAEVPGQRPGEKVQMVGKMTKDDWVNWHDEEPYAATEYVADLRATHKAQEIIGQMQTAGQYTDTINQVYTAHPELREVMDGRTPPESSPFWQVYDEVAREMPEAQQLAKGPLIVMREAERRVKERNLVDKEKQIADTAATAENDRQKRVGASFTTGNTSKPNSPVSKKLTAEEDKVARKLGMSPEEYNANRKVR